MTLPSGREANSATLGAATNIDAKRNGLMPNEAVTKLFSRNYFRAPGATYLRFSFRELHVEGRSAAAGALHIRILKLESCTLEAFDVIHHATVQVVDGGSVDEHFQAVHVKSLIHHSRGVLELHGIREAGASAAHHANAQACGNRALLSHNFLHLSDRAGSQVNRSFLRGCLRIAHFRDGCSGGHSDLLGFGKAS